MGRPACAGLLLAMASAAFGASPPRFAASAVAPEAPMSPSTIDPALRPLVELAVADLARRLAIDPADIALLEAQTVVWPDGSLGCPRPGMLYPQVQRDGLRIRLRARGTDYAYHGGHGRPPFLCEPAEKRR